MEIDQLNAMEKGLLLGALLDGPGAKARLPRLLGPGGERCRRAHQALHASDPARRRRRSLNLSRELFAPVPAGIEAVHPTWLVALLAPEPEAIRAVVLLALPPELVARLPLPLPPPAAPLPAARRALICRLVLGELVPLPPLAPVPPNAGELDDPAELIGWPADRLEATLHHLGILTLAALLSRTEPALRQRLLASVDPPLAAKVHHALALDLPPPPRSLRRLPTSGALPFPQLLVRLGAAHLRPALAPPLHRQLAQRLPHEIGRLLLEPPLARMDTDLLSWLRRAETWARGGAP